jgi:GNAT superfamily N-acetyltransferase/anti-sigma regulatory factor (Ser/Thr protein kinase)
MNVRERTREILRIKARDLDAIPAAGLAIERLAGSVGLSSLEASRFRFVVEELCADRIANGFAATQAAEVDIRLEHRPGEIVVLVDDAGMPLDPASTGAGARGMMAQFLERGFVDELHASFRGREGNRCTAIKFIGNALAELHGSAAAAPREVGESQPSAADAAGEAASAEIEYRAMRPEDAFEVARCFYRTYGLSAPAADEVIYHPERCAERVRSGLHLATVAVAAQGRIVGHTALERESLSDPIGIGGYLVVDPDYRGHGIAERLTEIRFKHGRELGLRGMLAMAVTVHTASQKTSLANGGHEVGVLLAAQEARIVMRGVGGHQGHERHSIVGFYFPWADLACDSYPPAAHSDLIARIYADCGIERGLRKAPDAFALEALPARSMLDVSILRAANHAKVRVKSYGRDFLSEVLHLVRDLHQHHVSVIRFEMPLSDPLTALFGNAAEELGFSFAAVFPGTAAGDLLCLQSLHGLEVNLADIHTASEHGAALLAAVIASHERVLSSKSARTIEGAERAFRSASAAA